MDVTTLCSLIFHWFIVSNHIVQYALETDPVTVELKADSSFDNVWLEVSEVVYTDTFHEQQVNHGGLDVVGIKDSLTWLELNKNLCLDLDHPNSATVNIHRTNEPTEVESEAIALIHTPSFTHRWTTWPERYLLKVEDYHYSKWNGSNIVSMDPFNVTLPMIPCN